MQTRNLPAVPATLARDAARAALITLALLSVPLVAMRFTRDVHWTVSDFGMAAVLLGGAALAILRALRLPLSRPRRAGLAAALALALLAVWVELAVGVFFRFGS